MKKRICLILALVMALAIAFTGCKGADNGTVDTEDAYDVLVLNGSTLSYHEPLWTMLSTNESTTETDATYVNLDSGAFFSVKRQDGETAAANGLETGDNLDALLKKYANLYGGKGTKFSDADTDKLFIRSVTFSYTGENSATFVYYATLTIDKETGDFMAVFAAHPKDVVAMVQSDIKNLVDNAQMTKIEPVNEIAQPEKNEPIEVEIESGASSEEE